ncbi:hypothetical protein PDJAM_G00214120 [Pangasius djambal]|uniref:Uncharacterized protein n=1 Tax=Pangasius djambal TaxID=1691987 RepID=A0ACC5YCI5_9TELE|nr:hypothetical protein [Pangasius djambal]
MEDYIKEALSLGFIRPSLRGRGSFLSRKKKGICGLNAVMQKDRYPLPLKNSAFERLQKVKIFSKLDLRSAYNLIRIRAGDEWKTAFIMPSGHYEYLLMPFGLMNAPAVFQRFINEVLQETLNHYAFVYLDDILIFSSLLEEHVVHVGRVLQLLLQNHLYVKLEKSQFHVTTISFLGFVVSQGRLSMDPDKVKAVTQWPQPTSVQLVQRFLGFANFFRRFIWDFSTLAAPLSALTKKTQAGFKWTREAQQAFETLKKKLTTAPVLHMPDPEAQFIVEVDASDIGVGAILSQHSGPDQKLHPCAYFSHRLTPSERNFDVGNRELLAVKLALQEWRHWLEGAKHQSLIWTDHKNLAYVQEAKHLNPRQSKWSLFFTRFNFVLSYRPRSKNLKPDALSRQWDIPSQEPSHEPIISPPRIEAPLRWGLEEAIHTAFCQEPDLGGGPPGKLYVPLTIWPQALSWGHTSPFAGHPEPWSFCADASGGPIWKRMSGPMWLPVSSLCGTRSHILAHLVCFIPSPSPLAHGPTFHWTSLQVYQRPRGWQLYWSSWIGSQRPVNSFPCPDSLRPRKTAKLLLQRVVRVHGFPTDLVSDRGPQFTSQFWKAFLPSLGGYR